MDLSEKIKYQRIKIGYSQVKLGEYLSISQQAVAKWEKGVAEPDSKNIAKMAELFKVSSDYLLGIDKLGIKTKNNNTVITIGRDGKRYEYDIPDENAELAQRLLSELSKKKDK